MYNDCLHLGGLSVCLSAMQQYTGR